MIGDSDIQVWLETQAATQPGVIVPYVQSAVDKRLSFRVRVIREGRSGRSEISQGGSIFTAAAQATPLGKMSLNVKDGDICEIELTLTEAGKPTDMYRFDCPR